MPITILNAKGYSFCKSYQYRDGKLVKKDIFLSRYFQLETGEADNLEQLSALLMRLEDDPSRLVIRGAATDEIDVSKPVRRKKADALSLPQEAPFVDKPISWLMLDIDKQLLPPTIDLLTQPVEAIEHFINQLPAEFHSCSVHYQLSGSAGVDYTDRVSAHLVFWLDKPTTSTQLKAWAKAVNSKHRLIDDALFNPVQPHYTSKPSFPTGYTDPFAGRRSGLIKKSHEAVTIDYTLVEKVKQHRLTHPQQHFEGVRGYENILAQLGDGLGGDGFHNPLLRSVASHVAVSGREKAEATRESLKVDLRERIESPRV